eukprot:13712385-Ditylum_brightwellii.AAC.1
MNIVPFHHQWHPLQIQYFIVPTLVKLILLFPIKTKTQQMTTMIIKMKMLPRCHCRFRLLYNVVVKPSKKQ